MCTSARTHACSCARSPVFFHPRDSPRETHANLFLRFTYRVSHSVISFIVPIILSFAVSLILSPLLPPGPTLSILSTVTHHASTRFVSFVSDNCHQRNDTMRKRTIPRCISIAAELIFMRLNHRRRNSRFDRPDHRKIRQHPFGLAIERFFEPVSTVLQFDNS